MDKNTMIVLVVLIAVMGTVIVFVSLPKSQVQKIVQTTCGNAICDSGESCQTCAEDCVCAANKKCIIDTPGADEKGCNVYCGNGECDARETCTSCPLDCHECTIIVTAKCGNHICETTNSEAIDNCPEDCVICGDKICSGPIEDKESCPDDCTICGDGVCDDEEVGLNKVYCIADCEDRYGSDQRPLLVVITIAALVVVILVRYFTKLRKVNKKK